MNPSCPDRLASHERTQIAPPVDGPNEPELPGPSRPDRLAFDWAQAASSRLHGRVCLVASAWSRLPVEYLDLEELRPFLGSDLLLPVEHLDLEELRSFLGFDLFLLVEYLYLEELRLFSGSDILLPVEHLDFEELRPFLGSDLLLPVVESRLHLVASRTCPRPHLFASAPVRVRTCSLFASAPALC